MVSTASQWCLLFFREKYTSLSIWECQRIFGLHHLRGTKRKLFWKRCFQQLWINNKLYLHQKRFEESENERLFTSFSGRQLYLVYLKVVSFDMFLKSWLPWNSDFLFHIVLYILCVQYILLVLKHLYMSPQQDKKKKKILGNYNS